MITIDERRKVAENLRSIKGTPEWATTAYCIAECLGEYDYPLWHDSYQLFNRLADLIDYPTTIIDVNKHGRAYCTNCGCDDRSLADGSNFCPNCGAKVVK